ncbi:3'-5' exonuclease [Cupriavidus basilensis]
MARFGSEDFAGGNTDSLEINYRSTPEIVDTFSSFAAGMVSAGAGSRLTSDRPPSGKPAEVLAVVEGGQLTPALADCIEEMRAAGVSYRDQAVLCRGNDRLSEVGQELERLGVPVLYLGSLFERPEVKDLVALLSLLVDRRAMGLIRTSCWPDFAMSMEDTVAVFEHLRSEQGEPGAWSDGLPGVSTSGNLALSRPAYGSSRFRRKLQSLVSACSRSLGWDADGCCVSFIEHSCGPGAWHCYLAIPELRARSAP